ncbi:MAG: NIL domain-containing protein [Verrucomicrobiota bacterium]
MAKEKQRFWLTYTSESASRPIIWEMGRKFDVVFNIRNASVTSEIGLIAIELEGEREVIKDVIQWLEERKVIVEPVEIQTIEG